MQRVTISLDDELAAAFDKLIARQGYENRSEAMRDLIRQRLDREAQDHAPRGHCVASLSYVYNHHERDLAERLTAQSHAHHDLVVSTMHAHLDHDNCLETVILRGPTAAVRAFADSVTAERGVRHGALNLIPADVNAGRKHHHGHHHGPDHPYHVHSRPKS